MASLFRKSLLLALAALPIGAHATDVYVFLLAGQSNMSGRGVTAGSPYVANSDILAYTGSNYDTNAALAQATNVLVQDYGTVSNSSGALTGNGVGPGGFFASGILASIQANDPGAQILLVNRSWGGTASALWLPSSVSKPNSPYPGTANLYNRALNAYEAAWTAVGAAGKTAKVGGILWAQGETDVDNGVSVATYTANTVAILNGFRDAIGSAHGLGPDAAKIVMGQISQTYPNGSKGGNSADLRTAQQDIATQLGAGFASSTGLTGTTYLTSDNVHYTTAAQAIMGQRMADAYTAVPEPSTYGLMGTGALAAVAFVRRRRKRAGLEK